ncbi:MAG: hypothetical protein HONBIEJF_01289 [Fimbriimonadaceae bacterium]|nr:hypothetical protein [Fimbriimonadaceae bacterium]
MSAILSLAIFLNQISVLDFGAKGDGATDNTVAFQRALDAAAQSSQVVFAPRGNYRFEGRLRVPRGVTLKGVWESVPSHAGLRDASEAKPTDDGTTFLVVGDRGKESSEAFMTISGNATLKGVVISYPDQKRDDVPVPYPFTLSLKGNNAAVTDVELLNPYRAIDLVGAHRHLVRNVQGQPLRLGVYVDGVTDIGRIENVHWNPWWSMSPKLFAWQKTHGEGFVFGRTDWQYVTNTFCFGYGIGYRFIETKAGVCNGNFLGIGADLCQTAVQVDQSAPYGLLITNGEFVSFEGPDPVMVRAAASHAGSVRFSNCAFWGPCEQIARVEGTGTVGFSDCTFVQWDRSGKGKPAIEALGGKLIVRGCEFREDKSHVRLAAEVSGAVIADNLTPRAIRLEDRRKR